MPSFSSVGYGIDVRFVTLRVSFVPSSFQYCQYCFTKCVVIFALGSVGSSAAV